MDIFCGIILKGLLIQYVIALEIAELNSDRIDCERSKVDHNVTLAYGDHAGAFLKANRSIGDMKKCLKQCCQMKGCDVALFTNGACYSVKCKNIESCAPTKNTDKRMHIEISYVATPGLKHTNTGKLENIEVHLIEQVEEGDYDVEVILLDISEEEQTSYVSINYQTDKKGEPALDDNLIAEVTEESPFPVEEGLLPINQLASQDDSDRELIRTRRESWKETKDMFIAIACGFVAVAVGVVGVITMTRQLVEDDDEILFGRSSDCFSREQFESTPTVSSNKQGIKRVPDEQLCQSELKN